MSVYKLPDGRYQARWSDPDKRQRAKIFPTKREATDHLAGVRTGMKAGSYTAHKPVVTLRRFAETRWLPFIGAYKRPNTASTYMTHYRTYIAPKLGSMKLGEIRRPDVQAFADYVARKVAPTTASTVLASLRSLLSLAVEDEVIAATPCTRIRLPEVAEREIVPLSAAQVQAVAAAITPRYEAAVWLAAGCGLREGEALGLLARRTDFLGRKINVVEQVQGGKLVPLKTKRSRRVVPADDLVLEKLAAHMKLWPPGPDGLLITNRLGRPVQRNSFGFCWREAVKAAGLPQGTRFHDLRHFYASCLIKAGLNVKVVQTRLGHATATETLDTYSHLWPDDAEAGRGLIEAVFAGQQAVSSSRTS